MRIKTCDKEMYDHYKNKLQTHDYIIPITKGYTLPEFSKPIGWSEIVDRKVNQTPKELMLNDISFLHKKGINCALLTYIIKHRTLIFLAREETDTDAFILDDYYVISSIAYAKMCIENKDETKILHEFLANEEIPLIFRNS